MTIITQNETKSESERLEELYDLLAHTEPGFYMRRDGNLDQWHDLVNAVMAEATRLEAVLQARRMEAYRAVIAAPVAIRTEAQILKELGY